MQEHTKFWLSSLQSIAYRGGDVSGTFFRYTYIVNYVFSGFQFEARYFDSSLLDDHEQNFLHLLSEGGCDIFIREMTEFQDFRMEGSIFPFGEINEIKPNTTGSCFSYRMSQCNFPDLLLF